MRQAGVLAAAGIVASKEMVDRPADDHALARDLAMRPAGIPGISVEPDRVETDIVIANIGETGVRSDDPRAPLGGRDIWISARPPHLVRFVTHRHIGDREVAILLDALRDVLLDAGRRAVGRG